jgi:hypothetical protein
VAEDPYRLLVMRDGEGEDLPVNLILALDATEELDDAPYRKGHAVGVLPVLRVTSPTVPLFTSQVKNGKNM